MGNDAKRKKVSLIFFLLLLCTASCNTTEPPDPPVPPEPILKLELEDVSCTEAWIQLTTNNLQLPATLNLLKDNNVTKIINLQTADTLLYIDSLLPNQTYNFRASGITNPTSGIKSNEISVTTMDTTSHDFTFQSWTFGTIGSSSLYDVAIINENNIWAVGDIKIADTSLNGYTMYNAVHWNGSEWELKQIFFPTVCGSSNLTSYPGKAIFAFDDGQIWISSSGDKIAILQDNMQINQYCLPSNVSMSINKIWGSGGSDLYVVGNGGNVAHYNGSQWRKIESGTSLDIYDIWGDYNDKTGEWEILAVASNFGTSLEKEILQIKNNSAITLSLSPQMWPLKTVWFIPDKQYYVAGAGVYQKRLLKDSLWKNQALDITSFSTYSIRGNNINDVFGVGAYGDLIHFNGISWKIDYNEPNLNLGSYKSVKTNSNLFLAVGNEYYQAVILKGKR